MTERDPDFEHERDPGSAPEHDPGESARPTLGRRDEPDSIRTDPDADEPGDRTLPSREGTTDPAGPA